MPVLMTTISTGKNKDNPILITRKISPSGAADQKGDFSIKKTEKTREGVSGFFLWVMFL